MGGGAAARRARRRSTPRALAGVGLGPGGRAHRARRAPTSTGPRAALGGPAARCTHRRQRPALRRRPNTATLDRRLPQRRGRAPRRRRRTWPTPSRTTASPAWTNGKRAVLLIVRRQPGANIIETIDRVQAPCCRSCAASISPAIDVASWPRPHPDHPRLGATTCELTLLPQRGAGGAGGVPLPAQRAAPPLIPSVAVPLSLIGTFGVMYLLGYSLDNLSLMALTISTGFVVDDAIVVIENIARYLEQGMPPLAGRAQGRQARSASPSSPSRISLVAVFIPILLMGGIVGRLFREFAVTLSVAIAVSAVVSLTLTPDDVRALPACRDARARARPALPRRPSAPSTACSAATTARSALGARAIRSSCCSSPLAAVGAQRLRSTSCMPKGFFPQQDTGLLIGLHPRRRRTSPSPP